MAFRFAAAFLFIGLGSGSAGAASFIDPQFTWIGRAVVQARTDACGPIFQLGMEYDFVYRPLLRQGERNPAVTFTAPMFHAIFQRRGPPGSTGVIIPPPTSGAAMMAGEGTWEAFLSGAKAFINNPSAVNNSTPVIDLRGTYNFDLQGAHVNASASGVFINPGILKFGQGPFAGCVVTFYASVTRYPGIFDPDEA